MQGPIFSEVFPSGSAETNQIKRDAIAARPSISKLYATGALFGRSVMSVAVQRDKPAFVRWVDSSPNRGNRAIGSRLIPRSEVLCHGPREKVDAPANARRCCVADWDVIVLGSGAHGITTGAAGVQARCTAILPQGSRR